MRRGDWSGLAVPIHVCIRSGCVVFPRYVGRVRKMNLCFSRNQPKNIWYDFMPREGICSSWNNSNWWGNASWGSWLGGAARVIQQNQTPVFQDVAGEGRLIRAYATYRTDIGKDVTIFGIDNDGQTLMHKNLDGTWSDGIILNIQAPWGSTSTFVRHIDRVLLDDMQGPVRLYGYDIANDVLEDIAMYEPGETNPSYTRYQVGSHCSNKDCGCTRSLVALVKLRFIPVRFDTDLVLIENLDALKDMIQSLIFKESGDIKNSAAFEASAIREMNLQMSDDMADDTIPISLGELGNTRIGLQKML